MDTQREWAQFMLAAEYAFVMSANAAQARDFLLKERPLDHFQAETCPSHFYLESEFGSYDIIHRWISGPPNHGRDKPRATVLLTGIVGALAQSTRRAPSEFILPADSPDAIHIRLFAAARQAREETPSTSCRFYVDTTDGDTISIPLRWLQVERLWHISKETLSSALLTAYQFLRFGRHAEIVTKIAEAMSSDHIVRGYYLRSWMKGELL